MHTTVSSVILCIEKYIQDNHLCSLICLSELAEYCKRLDGLAAISYSSKYYKELESNIYLALLELEKLNKVKIIKRYSCSEAHSIPVDSLPYCAECDYEYSMAYITTHIYMVPVK